MNIFSNFLWFKNTNMLGVISVVAVFSLLFTSSIVSAEPKAFVGLIDHTRVIEDAGPLRISLDEKSLTGFVEVETCHVTCVDTRLVITPATEAYNKATKVPLEEAGKRLGRFAEIIYDVNTNKVVRISW